MRGDELVGWDTGARVMGTGSRIAEMREHRLPFKAIGSLLPIRNSGSATMYGNTRTKALCTRTVGDHVTATPSAEAAVAYQPK